MRRRGIQSLVRVWQFQLHVCRPIDPSSGMMIMNGRCIGGISGLVPHASDTEVSLRNLMGKRMGMMGKTENPFNTENARTPCTAGGSIGAEDGIRTRDPHLGKVMLYH